MSSTLATPTTQLPNWQASVARAFSRAAPQYDALASAQREIGKALWRALPTHAKSVLDLGCGTGYWTQQLAARYPHAHLTGLDIAPGMLAHAQALYGDVITWQQGDAAALPFESSRFDLIVSNLAIQWCSDINAVMQELARVLTPGGEVHITTLLPGTLKEVATAWQRPEALLQMPDAASVERAVAQSGLTLVRSTAEQRQFYYPDLRAVMASIKGVGAQVTRSNAQLTRRELAAAQARFETLREPQGLPVSYHCFTLHLEKTP
ncbi:malonyl-ACP O-methyltransferase BioC [Halomonas sp. 7T]|uniref:malonyl-ACP O-methyltransferase BioC n=1 Tax=Halomonas sp. 7T TaxID=2893469 RepID=UPI0021DB7576|nr:malonyl-ACP O-methyltransferase BioC [Halomonas sp. 7T]UXZ54640.1 malonyl-ACP O-methyltransferase BioC [Halomonas sp. 7T]